MWQLLLVGYFIFGAAGYILRRHFAQTIAEHNRLINAISFVCFTFPTGVLLSLFFPHNFHIGFGLLVYILVLSLSFPIYQILAFKSNQHLDAGTFTLVSSLSPISTLPVGLILLHESISSLQYLGIALLIISAGVVALPAIRARGQRDAQGFVLAIGAVALLGAALGFERYALTHVDIGVYFVIGWGAQAAWSAILALRDRQELSKLLRDKANRRRVTLYGSSTAIKAACFILALKLASSASVVSAATDFSVVVVVIAAYFVLKEKDHLVYKFGAATVGIAGLLLLAR